MDEARNKLSIMKRYLVHSMVAGAIGALLCTWWTASWAAFYNPVWVEEFFIVRTFSIYWLCWSLAMSVVLPAILCDEFSSQTQTFVE